MTTIEQAKEILGEENVFGPDEWRKYFGEKGQFSESLEIPWGVQTLSNPKIQQKHFLFLGQNSIDGNPLNLLAWCKLYDGKKHPKFNNEPFSGSVILNPQYPSGFYVQTCEFQWYLMPIGVIKKSTSHTLSEQKKMLTDWYTVPKVIERVTANFLYFLINHKYLDALIEARTNPGKNDDQFFTAITVKGSGHHGILISSRDNDAYSSIGISASRWNPVIESDKSLREEEKTRLEEEARRNYLLRNK
jgi:hypothetical protein